MLGPAAGGQVILLGVATLEERRAEFDANVWDHTADAFQMEFDVRRPLDADELAMLAEVCEALGRGCDDDEIAELIHELVDGDRDMLLVLMQQAGLTRNKILTDLKARRAELGIRVPADPGGLLSNSAAWAAAGPYLAARLREVLEPLATLDDPGVGFEAVNQATWPHWIRQERAKRQGHEAEYRVAVMLDALGIPFVPEEKSENPLCRDAQIDGISYDLVVPDLDEPVMVLKSTVQTSNIGQFGESKAHLEVTQAADSLENTYDEAPMLVALVDGVGFHSNTAGLHGVLESVDHFCQFKTIWKAAVIAAVPQEIALNLALSEASIRAHDEFLEEYGDGITVHTATDGLRRRLPAMHVVDAGEAFIWRP